MKKTCVCSGCRTSICIEDLSHRELFELAAIPAVDHFSQDKSASLESKLYPLSIYQCPTCKLVQVSESPSVELFYERYIYESSSSPDMRDNFISLKESILELITDNQRVKRVLDIGCNDGLLLSLFDEDSYELYGTDPSPIAKKAQKTNYTLFSEYFPGQHALKNGPYDVIIGTNSLAHIPNIGDCFSSIASILADDGFLVIEVSDFERMGDAGAWDYIYHEHLYYYTVESLATLLKSNGLNIIRVDDVPTKGGSLRVFANKKCTNTMFQNESSATNILDALKKSYAGCVDCYQSLGQKYPHANIYGYGACATGSVALAQSSFFRRIEKIIDDNPKRQGLFTPHWGQEVVPLSNIKFQAGDLVIVFAWRFIDKIEKNITEYCHRMHMVKPLIVNAMHPWSASRHLDSSVRQGT